MFHVVYEGEGVNYSNWDGAIKQWGKIITGIEHWSLGWNNKCEDYSINNWDVAKMNNKKKN